MKNDFLKIDFYRLIFYLIIIFTILYGFNYLIFGSSNSWDSIGHVDLALNIKNNLWPDFSGWNAAYYMGFQQGTYYPPLFHYILAIMIFFIHPEIASKLLIFIIFLLMIYSFYFFSKKIGLNKENSRYLTIFLLLGWILTWVLPDKSIGVPGMDPYSTFVIGLWPMFLALPLIFFFLGYFFEFLRTGKNYKQAGCFFGLAILAHFISLALVIPIIFSLIFFKKQKVKIIKTLIIGLLISALWLIPFLFYNNFLLKPFYYAEHTSIIAALISVSYIFSIFQKNKLAKILSLSMITIFILWVLVTINELPHQIFRLQSIIILFSIIPIFFFIKEKLSKNLLNYFYIIAAIIYVSQIFFIPQFYIYTITEPIYDERLSGQTLLLQNDFIGDYHEKYISFYHKTDSKSLRGLFVESTLTGELACIIAKYYDPNDGCWGTHASEKIQYQRGIIDKQVEALNVNQIITNKKITGKIPGYISDKPYLIRHSFEYNLDSELFFIPTENKISKHYENIYFLEEKPTAIVPKKVQSKDISSFDEIRNFVRNEWFFNNDETIYAFTNENINFETNKKIKVDYSESENNQEIYLDVKSYEAVPILIRQNWFFNWRAYDSNGIELPIYIATPYSILIIGKGEITLKNEKTFIEILARLISTLTILFLIILYIYQEKTKIRKYFIKLKKHINMNKKSNLDKRIFNIRNKLIKNISLENIILAIFFIIFIFLITYNNYELKPYGELEIIQSGNPFSQIDIGNVLSNPFSYFFYSGGNIFCIFEDKKEMYIYKGELLFLDNNNNSFFYKTYDSSMNNLDTNFKLDQNVDLFYDFAGEPLHCELGKSVENGYYEKVKEILKNETLKTD